LKINIRKKKSPMSLPVECWWNAGLNAKARMLSRTGHLFLIPDFQKSSPVATEVIF